MKIERILGEVMLYVITFSGDKMLGGPQCGIILGKKDIVSAIKANQSNRALRVDKLTLIALQETLLSFKKYLDTC